MEKKDAILRLVWGVMADELEANKHKGDNWTNMSKKEFLFELYYHVGKLQNAIMSDDVENVKQYTADILNTCGFLLDTLDQKLIYHSSL